MIEIIIVCMLLFWTDFTPGVQAATDTKVSASLPINPVETGAVFALHCQVWNLEDGQSVQVFKTTTGRSQQLSIDGAVVPGIEERVFLAVRHMGDGSMIFFLSITDASLEDEAEYSCKVIRTFPSLEEVTQHAVSLEVMYFPSVSNPVCDSLQPDVIYEGDVITLTCHSEVGNPAVSISWSRTGSEKSLDAEESTVDGRVYSVVNIRARFRDSGAVFLCEIASKAFPGTIQTCHVGPVIILRNPHGPPFIPDLTTTVPKDIINVVQTGGQSEGSLKPEDCQDICDVITESAVFYWVIGTIVAGVLALLFCVVCLALLLKFCKTPAEEITEDYSPPLEDADKIYVEVESKRDSGKMYMSLVKPYPESHILQQVPQKM